MMESISENHIITERREKLASLRQTSTAYPNHFRPTHSLSEIRFLCQNELPTFLVRLAGRITSIRRQGKISFMTVQDTDNQLQLFISQSEVPSQYEQSKTWDLGDIVGVEGHLMQTQKGELSLRVNSLSLLTKSIIRIF